MGFPSHTQPVSERCPKRTTSKHLVDQGRAGAGFRPGKAKLLVLKCGRLCGGDDDWGIIQSIDIHSKSLQDDRGGAEIGGAE